MGPDCTSRSGLVAHCREETNGRFCKRAILANAPSFPFFWGPGISKITVFFCQGSTAGKDFLEEISVQGNICQNYPLGNHPLANPDIELLHAPHDPRSGTSSSCKLVVTPTSRTCAQALRYKWEGSVIHIGGIAVQTVILVSLSFDGLGAGKVLQYKWVLQCCGGGWGLRHPSNPSCSKPPNCKRAHEPRRFLSGKTSISMNTLFLRKIASQTS